MKKYDSTKIKNIAIAGQAGSGKTSLAEALLYKSGATDRLGKVLDGNTVSDYTAEEIKRKCSVYTSLSSLETGEYKVNLLDTPGLFDYEGEVVEGICASGCVMITVSGKSGVRVGTHKAYDLAKSMGKPTMFVVTKLDDDNANFNNVLTQLKAEFGPTVCPVVVPVIADRKIVSYVNLIEMKAYKYVDGKAVETDMPTAEVSEKMEYRIDGLIEAVSESVAETDEALFEKFFSGEAFTQKEIIDGIHKGMNSGVITPVTCVSSTDMSGVDMLLKEIDLLLPPPSEKDAMIGETADGEAVEVVCSENDPLSAFVFKTVADPFVGKMSYIKVFSGKLAQNKEVVNATTGTAEKVGKLVTLQGKKQIDLAEAGCGDIVVAMKMNVNTNDTICDSSRVIKFAPMKFPKPCYKMAVKAKKQGDESKISASMNRLMEEDLTIRYEMDSSTNEMILSTLGGLHLDSVVGRLAGTFGVEVETSVPKISYRETIRKKVKVQGKHKKQSGGHGQYGHVKMTFEPSGDLEQPYVFEQIVVGGAVPKNYFPAVEKGIQEGVLKGPMAAYPVVGIKAVLYDGSYHPVDSSEMAFKVAALGAFKKGIMDASPILLEPIATLKVVVPDKYTGDVMGDLNKRRGRVLGMNPVDGGYQEILADIPYMELYGYNTDLRSMTGGSGTYSYEFARYEQTPSDIQEKEIAARAGKVEDIEA